MARKYIERIKAEQRAREVTHDMEYDMDELGHGGTAIAQQLLSDAPVDERETTINALTLSAVVAYRRGMSAFVATLERFAAEYADDEQFRRDLVASIKAAVRS